MMALLCMTIIIVYYFLCCVALQHFVYKIKLSLAENDTRIRHCDYNGDRGAGGDRVTTTTSTTVYMHARNYSC